MNEWENMVNVFDALAQESEIIKLHNCRLVIAGYTVDVRRDGEQWVAHVSNRVAIGPCEYVAAIAKARSVCTQLRAIDERLQPLLAERCVLLGASAEAAAAQAAQEMEGIR